MVNMEVPAGVVFEVETLRVADPEPPLTEVGVKLPLAPLGTPLTLKPTFPLKPFSALTVAV